MKVYVVYFEEPYEYGPPEKAFASREGAESYLKSLPYGDSYEIEELELE